jgi:hypothetical protein
MQLKKGRMWNNTNRKTTACFGTLLWWTLSPPIMTTLVHTSIMLGNDLTKPNPINYLNLPYKQKHAHITICQRQSLYTHRFKKMMLKMNHPYKFVGDGEQQQDHRYQQPVMDVDGNNINPTIMVAAASALHGIGDVMSTTTTTTDLATSAVSAAAAAAAAAAGVVDHKRPSNTISISLHALPRMSITKPILLPSDFHPHPYSVILGRGTKVKESTGNRRLHVLVELELQNYVKAPTRKEKSYVVGRVMKTIQNASRSSFGTPFSSPDHPASCGAFIRSEKDRWIEVDDATAREKIGTIFRDKLSHNYKSSTHQKVERRRELREATAKRTSLSSSSSAAVAATAAQGQHDQQDHQHPKQYNDTAGVVYDCHRDGNMELDTKLPPPASSALSTFPIMGPPIMEVEFDFDLFKDMVEKDSKYSPFSDAAVDYRGTEQQDSSSHPTQRWGQHQSGCNTSNGYSSSITTLSSNSSICSGPSSGGDGGGDDTMMWRTFV